MQLLWLFKINNLMNFKLALLKYLENCFKNKTINTVIKLNYYLLAYNKGYLIFDLQRLFMRILVS